MFVLDSDVLSALADTLSTPVAGLPSYWSTIVTSAHTTAYQDILSRLAERGFTPAQIAAWDRGAEFETRLALFHSLTRGGALAAYDDRYVKLLDVRAELKTVLIAVNGVWTHPGDTPGTVGVGEMDGGGDLFGTVTDPDDTRIGRPIRW